MMKLKHAFLVTAYHDLPTLNRMVDKFSKYGDVLVHIDKRSVINTQDIVFHEGVCVYKRYCINWGSFNHLRSILFLLKQAMKLHPDYVHVITGEDYPIVSDELFDVFFAEKNGFSFLSLSCVDDCSWIRERYSYYWFTDLIRHPKDGNYALHPVISELLKWQKKLGIKRRKIGPFERNELYKGLVYVSLHKNAAQYVLDYMKTHKSFLRSLKTCLIPEEFFFQTLLVNSPLRDKLVNDNLRYMDWQFRDGISPCVLNETDYETIKQSGKLIMRKVSAKSEKLIEMLHEKV